MYNSDISLEIIAKVVLIDKLYAYKSITKEEARKQLEKLAKKNFPEINIGNEALKKEEEHRAHINEVNMMIDDFEDKLVRGY